MTGRFERVHRRRRQLTGSERLQLILAIAAVVIGLELWWGERLGFGLGVIAGWALRELDYWLGPRGG